MKDYSLDIAASMDFIKRRRPFMESLFNLFKPLLEARHGLVQELVRDFLNDNIVAPKFQREKAEKGITLLSEENLAFLKPYITRVTEKLLPLLLALPSIREHKRSLEKIFFQDADNMEKLFTAILSGNEEYIFKMARESGAPSDILFFTADFLLSPLLRALVKLEKSEDSDFPWNEEGVWNKGYCPVCGDFPVIAWLDRAKMDEKNTFLVGGGGKKNFHCSLCGASWKFRRGLCPSCSQEGDGVMQILQDTDAYGERIDFCTKCNTYCPTVDLREFGDTPDMDVMALGMFHMDIVASQKKLESLKPTFWNRF